MASSSDSYGGFSDLLWLPLVAYSSGFFWFVIMVSSGVSSGFFLWRFLVSCASGLFFWRRRGLLFWRIPMVCYSGFLWFLLVYYYSGFFFWPLLMVSPRCYLSYGLLLRCVLMVCSSGCFWFLPNFVFSYIGFGSHVGSSSGSSTGLLLLLWVLPLVSYSRVVFRVSSYPAFFLARRIVIMVSACSSVLFLGFFLSWCLLLVSSVFFYSWFIIILALSPIGLFVYRFFSSWLDLLADPSYSSYGYSYSGVLFYWLIVMVFSGLDLLVVGSSSGLLL